jgi:hypothetical protein
MKTYRLFFIIVLSIVFFRCDRGDDLVKNIQDKDQVVLNSSVEVIASKEETVENLIDLLDYEIDLYSFFEAEYQPKGANFFYQFHNDIIAWNRYQNRRFPNVSIRSVKPNSRYPLKLSFKYTDNIAFRNGQILKGIVDVEISDAVFNKNSKRKIKYNLFIDDVEIVGEKTIKTKEIINEKLRFVINSEIKFVFPDTSILYRLDDREMIWHGHYSFFYTNDDVVQMRGKTTCIDTDQNKYIKTIDEQRPLIKMGFCDNITSGVANYSQNKIDFATVDYGQGSCNNIASLKYKKGNTEIIKEFVVGDHKRKK